MRGLRTPGQPTPGQPLEQLAQVHDPAPRRRTRLCTGKRVRAEEIVLRIPDGRSITTLQDLQPIRDLERLRSEFLGKVGHELRVPLSSI